MMFASVSHIYADWNGIFRRVRGLEVGRMRRCECYNRFYWFPIVFISVWLALRIHKVLIFMLASIRGWYPILTSNIQVNGHIQLKHFIFYHQSHTRNCSSVSVCGWCSIQIGYRSVSSINGKCSNGSHWFSLCFLFCRLSREWKQSCCFWLTVISNWLLVLWWKTSILIVTTEKN